jgi:cytoskeletal protein CcmA (bactofilin family)
MARVGLRNGIAALLLLLCLLPATSGLAAAQSFQGAAGTIVVEEGETYEDIQGFAGSVVVRGTVTGDVSAVAGSIHVTETGRVGGSVQASAGTVRVAGTVDGDVSVAGGTVEITESARIGGEVRAGAGYALVDGAVDGSVQVGAETVVLGPNAAVGGDFRYDAETFTRDPGASVGGEVVRDADLGGDVGPTFGEFRLPSWVATVYGFFANLLLGALLLGLLPRFSEAVASEATDVPLRSGGVGLLALLGVPVLLVALLLTVVGIPLALVGMLAYAVALWIGSVYGQYAVGAWALEAAGEDSRWLALVVGLLAFAVLGLVPILGGLLGLLVLLLGLGALALALRDSYRGRSSAPE